jgi:HTH-type transcriptional regulator / antitoxin HipB
MFSMSTIGQLVKANRKLSGLTQHELAELAGIGKTSVFDIEKGKVSVKLDTLLAVFNVLNIKFVFNSPAGEQHETG